MSIDIEIQGETITLTEKQKKFCELYAYSELRGNGVKCYAESYGYDLEEKGSYAVCASGAKENLIKPHILSYIRSMYQGILNDDVVDNELSFLVSQNADFGAKLGAIKEYNNLKSRITKKFEHSGNIGIEYDPDKMTDEQIRQRLKDLGD